MDEAAENIKSQIMQLVRDYYEAAFQSNRFIPGETLVPYSGRVFDDEELAILVESALDFWLTSGRFSEQFEHEFADFCGSRYAMLVNSGSSANLLALSCLTSPKLGERRLKPGDEVITVATAFPTTVNPIVQCRLTPVFIDVTVPTYNADVEQIEAALSGRTRAIILAHTLGNPFDVATVADIARRHNLWLIEDCCDAVGSSYNGQNVGTFGDLSTVSFYPAHHITMGEGGCVLTNSLQLKNLVESFRDWGRDCWCKPGKSNSCNKRFDRQLGQLPYGYDHKYIYSHIGYNLKLTDMQAAVGVAQLKKLPAFIEARRRNFRMLYEGLRDMQEWFVLPEATPKSNPSWFGFPLALSTKAHFTREQVIHYLESAKISTRLLFSGNLVRQPAFCDNADIDFRVFGDLRNSDFVMNRVFWIGVYPGLSPEMIDYMLECLHKIPKEL